MSFYMTYLTAPNKYVLYLETLFSVRFAYSNHIFDTPTKCKYTIKYMFYYQYSPTCFGVMCHLQGGPLSYAQNYVTIFDYTSEDTIYMGNNI